MRAPAQRVSRRPLLPRHFDASTSHAIACESVIMAAVPSPLQNHILEALPEAVRERLFPHLKLITSPRGAVFVRGRLAAS